MPESANMEEEEEECRQNAASAHTQSYMHIPESANTEKEWAAAEQKATGMQAMMSSFVVWGTERASGAACSRILSVSIALAR